MLEMAIDIGGTCTDIVCLQDLQRLYLAKVSTTSSFAETLWPLNHAS
jgi:N-methylhydantoinase A/oxoprolinase/acetone carboxylase beta subunit